MANKILLKRSGTASSVPTSGDLTDGEIALNYNDGIIHYKDSVGTVKDIHEACQGLTGPRAVVAGTSARVDLENDGPADPTIWNDVFQFTMYRTLGTSLFLQVTWSIEQVSNVQGNYYGGKIVRGGSGSPVTGGTALSGTSNSTIQVSGDLTWETGMIPLNANHQVGESESMVYSSPHYDTDTALSGYHTYTVQIIADYTSDTGGGPAGNQFVEAIVTGIES